MKILAGILGLTYWLLFWAPFGICFVLAILAFRMSCWEDEARERARQNGGIQ